MEHAEREQSRASKYIYISAQNIMEMMKAKAESPTFQLKHVRSDSMESISIEKNFVAWQMYIMSNILLV
jgi:hypothetical protein